jgi:ornithine cyclodeaminase
MPQLRFLSRDDVQAALPMPAAIAAMNVAYSQLSTGNSDMPLRSRTAMAGEGVLLTMPALLSESNQLGVKIVSVVPENTARNLPMIHALVMALDAATGQPLAILEGQSLTAIRTGAGAGAATDALARSDSSTVAIIGSGTQARTQLMAMCAVRSIDTVYLYSPTTDHARQFAEEMAGRGSIPAAIHITDTPEDAVRQADIVCTATDSQTPVFDGHSLQPGTHINAIGSYMPSMQEVDDVTLQQALIVVDSAEAVLKEAGELIMALENGTLTPDDVQLEIGHVLTGSHPGRSSAEQITYFKSVGVAVQDAAAAHVALQQAEANNLGTLLDL